MNNTNDITVFAETNFRDKKRCFGIKIDDRRRHMYLIGKTGMGKSTMLENMIINDIKNGRGVAVVDPHGDLVEKVIDFIPSSRINDVINFNPADMDYPIAFNPLESIDPRYKHLISSGLIGVFKKLWAESWGPRLEYLLRNALLALLDNKGTTLLGIMRILVDKNYRKKIISNIEDPVVKAFWVEEYSKYPDKFQVEAISPIQNKVGQFLSNFLIRNIVGQVKSSFDMREIMDDKKILLMNLSKGRIGEDTSSLLGAMMITKIQLAAMDRIDIPEEERTDFYLYVDEFQNFATESFATILSEARKYRLNLIMAHQYIEQLNDVVRPAVFGNVGTIVVFRVGAADAEELVKEFTPKFLEEDLVNIPKWECYMKLMVDGIATDPFSASGLPPFKQEDKTNNKDKIITLSRERYAEKREIVEERISRWSGPLQENPAGSRDAINLPAPTGAGRRAGYISKTEMTADKATKSQLNGNNSLGRQENNIKEYENNNTGFEIKTAKSYDNKIKNIGNSWNIKNNTAGYEEKFKVKCDSCGEETTVNFRPDNIREVYCRDCLNKIRRGEIRMPLKKKNFKNKNIIENKRLEQKAELLRENKISEMPHKKRVAKNAENKAETARESEERFAKNEEDDDDYYDEEGGDEMSLMDAMKIGASDFRGKKIQNSADSVSKMIIGDEHEDEQENSKNIIAGKNENKLDIQKKMQRGRVIKI